MSAALDVDERRLQLSKLAGDLGFTKDLLSTDFRVWTGTAVLRPDLVGFGAAEPHDVTTATFLANAAPGDGDVALDAHFDAARILATPVSVIGRAKGWELWKTGSRPDADERLREGQWGSADALTDLRFDLSPQALLQAKHQTRQLSLLPVDVRLLETARQSIEGSLAERVVAAVREVVPEASDHATVGEVRGAARLVIGALTALMLRDKVLERPDMTGWPVVEAASRLYPEHFSWLADMGPKDRTRLEQTLATIGEGVDFAALDPTLVSDVYEHAIIGERRSTIGAYYTPIELTRRILATLPVEQIAPEQRVTGDLACGSGSFLLAAHERLRDALPGPLSLREQHQYLRTHLTGSDTDPLAVEIARLSLLLAALPAGDGWKVEVADGLEVDTPLGIAVSNPPWSQSRDADGRAERAEPFLDVMLDRLAPGGLLACVLPAGWLSNRFSGDSRRRLRERAEVLEVWRLTETVFPSGRMAPCVVFAERRQDGVRRGYVTRTIRNRELAAFYRSGRAPDSGLVLEAADPSAPFTGTSEILREALASLPRLQGIASVLSGPPPRRVNAVGQQGGDLLWLREAKAVAPFARVSDNVLQRCRFPEDFSRPDTATPDQYLVPKLLVPAKRWADTPWRVIARVDDHGVIPRETLYGITPRDPLDERIRYALVPLLGSSVASALVGNASASRNIPSKAYRLLPVPPDGPVWDDLAELGLKIVDAASFGRPLEQLMLQLEETVADAYRLPDEVRVLLRSQFATIAAPEGVVRFPDAPVTLQGLDAECEASLSSGAVLDIDPPHVLISVAGVTPPEGQWMIAPQALSGALCRPGATFDVRGGEQGLAEARFVPQRLAYMPLDDALAELGFA